MNPTTDSGSSLRADAKRIVTQVSGEAITQVTRVATGVMTFKYFVESADGHRYVVRFYPRERAAVVGYEPDVVRRCRAHGMRVPEVLASSRTGPKASLQYMIYKMLPGISLDLRLAVLTPQALSRICSGLIAELRVLNGIEISGFGDLVDGTRARFDSWLSFVGRTFIVGVAAARAQSLLPSKLLDAVNLIGQNLDRFAYAGQPALCWGDISPQNIIVSEDEELVGLVDFEGVLGAEFDLHLGYLRAKYAGTDFYSTLAAAWPGGRDKAASARAALYALVRALRLVPHGRAPLPTGIQREPLEIFLPGLKEAIDESLRWLDERAPGSANVKKESL